MFIAGAKLHHRLTGRPPLYAWHIVVRLQSVQRTVRAIRHQGIRQQEQQRKLSYWQWALTIVGWRTASDEHAIAESEREKSRPPSSRASSVERHNDSIEDLLTKQYKSDGETSDESFQMPSDVNTDSETESEYNTSDYDSLSHSDGGSELTMVRLIVTILYRVLMYLYLFLHRTTSTNRIVRTAAVRRIVRNSTRMVQSLQCPPITSANTRTSRTSRRPALSLWTHHRISVTIISHRRIGHRRQRPTNRWAPKKMKRDPLRRAPDRCRC